MKNQHQHINQKAAEAFKRMTSHQPLKASDDFFDELEAKLDARVEGPATVYAFQPADWLKVAALITIMLLNGILLFTVMQQQPFSSDNPDDYSTVVDDYFPQYQTLNEDLE
jgi:hypothetical protein